MLWRLKKLNDETITPGKTFLVVLLNGEVEEVVWVGNAFYDRIDWWLEQPGHALARLSEITAIGFRIDDERELAWLAPPAGPELFFIVEPITFGRRDLVYRPARMVIQY
jgi:hypothetical protein